MKSLYLLLNFSFAIYMYTFYLMYDAFQSSFVCNMYVFTIQVPNVFLGLPTLRQVPELQDAQVQHDSAFVKWNRWSNSSDGAGDGPVDLYIIKYKKTWQREIDSVPQYTFIRVDDTSVCTGSTCNYDLKGLEPNTQYSISVLPVRPGVGGIGKGATSAFTTKRYCE